jgi:hypothetical protein
VRFWDTIYLLVSTFFFVAYLIVLFHVILDLFRDPSLGGFAKAVWIVALIFLPVLTSLIYVIARGRGMSERQRTAYAKAQADADAHIREVAGHRSPAEQIASAKQLLDSGAITPDEFARLKATALASSAGPLPAASAH